MVPEEGGVRDRLERERVLGESGNGKRPRDGADGDDEVLVAEPEELRLGLHLYPACREVVLSRASEDELGVRAHETKRDDGVTGLERSRRRLREERRVEHEVLRAHDGCASTSQETCDVAPGEPAADDEDTPACVSTCAHSRSLACAAGPVSPVRVWRRICSFGPRRCSVAGMALQVSVIGSGAEWEARAEEVGRLLAERGCVVVTGGLGEVMAATCRGAKAAGGTTIGIVPGESRAAANPWVDHVVATGIGHARNLAVVASGDVVIAVGGRWGTLAEIAFARVLARPVVVLEPGWAVEGDGVERADSPADAVELALRLAAG